LQEVHSGERGEKSSYEESDWFIELSQEGKDKIKNKESCQQ
jgi:hypothetical protein